MVLLQNAVAALAARAGWRTPPPDGDGAYRFRLVNCPDFTLFSPDGRVCVMRAELMSMPAPKAERDGLLRLVAQWQAGACRSRASVVALERSDEGMPTDIVPDERLVLFRKVDLSAGEAVFNAAVRDFLNDLTWWKAACDGSAAGTSGETPSFSLSGIFLGSRY